MVAIRYVTYCTALGHNLHFFSTVKISFSEQQKGRDSHLFSFSSSHARCTKQPETQLKERVLTALVILFIYRVLQGTPHYNGKRKKEFI